jgi:hypothetical protein
MEIGGGVKLWKRRVGSGRDGEVGTGMTDGERWGVGWEGEVGRVEGLAGQGACYIGMIVCFFGTGGTCLSRNRRSD